MKRFFCFITAAAALLCAASFLCPAYAQNGKMLTGIKYKIDNKKEQSDNDDDDWREWVLYDFLYDKDGHLSEFTHTDDNFYEFFKLEYTSMAIVSTSGSNDIDSSDSRQIVVYYLFDDRPEFISAAYYTIKDGTYDVREWDLESGSSITLYNNKGELTSIRHSSGHTSSFIWKAGNLVTIKKSDNSTVTFEYGSAQNKLGPLAFAMPMIQLYTPLSLEVFITMGINPKNLPVKVIEQNGSQVSTYTLSYTFDSDGYPVQVETEEGEILEFNYSL